MTPSARAVRRHQHVIACPVRKSSVSALRSTVATGQLRFNASAATPAAAAGAAERELPNASSKSAPPVRSSISATVTLAPAAVGATTTLSQGSTSCMMCVERRCLRSFRRAQPEQALAPGAVASTSGRCSSRRDDVGCLDQRPRQRRLTSRPAEASVRRSSRAVMRTCAPAPGRASAASVPGPAGRVRRCSRARQPRIGRANRKEAPSAPAPRAAVDDVVAESQSPGRAESVRRACAGVCLRRRWGRACR